MHSSQQPSYYLSRIPGDCAPSASSPSVTLQPPLSLLSPSSLTALCCACAFLCPFNHLPPLSLPSSVLQARPVHSTLRSCLDILSTLMDLTSMSLASDHIDISTAPRQCHSPCSSHVGSPKTCQKFQRHRPGIRRPCTVRNPASSAAQSLLVTLCWCSVFLCIPDLRSPTFMTCPCPWAYYPIPTT